MIESPTFEHTMQALYDYGERIAELYKRRLQNDGKKATGNLINSVEAKVAYKGTEYVVYLELADYWKYVEKGRKKGKFPPTDKILEWIRVKHIIPRPGTDGRLPTEQQLAFLISRSIAREGIPEGNQLRDSVQGINTTYLPILQEALAQDWETYALYIKDDIDKFMRI